MGTLESSMARDLGVRQRRRYSFIPLTSTHQWLASCQPSAHPGDPRDVREAEPHSQETHSVRRWPANEETILSTSRSLEKGVCGCDSGEASEWEGV